jgi:hypothetical protein
MSGKLSPEAREENHQPVSLGRGTRNPKGAPLVPYDKRALWNELFVSSVESEVSDIPIIGAWLVRVLSKL